MEQEIWKSITGYEGIYEISNNRKIKSLRRMSACGRLLREKELKFSKNGKYDVIQLTDKNGKAKIYYVDNLMFEHFNK